MIISTKRETLAQILSAGSYILYNIKDNHIYAKILMEKVHLLHFIFLEIVWISDNMGTEDTSKPTLLNTSDNERYVWLVLRDENSCFFKKRLILVKHTIIYILVNVAPLKKLAFWCWHNVLWHKTDENSIIKKSPLAKINMLGYILLNILNNQKPVFVEWVLFLEEI